MGRRFSGAIRFCGAMGAGRGSASLPPLLYVYLLLLPACAGRQIAVPPNGAGGPLKISEVRAEEPGREDASEGRGETIAERGPAAVAGRASSGSRTEGPPPPPDPAPAPPPAPAAVPAAPPPSPEDELLLRLWAAPDEGLCDSLEASSPESFHRPGVREACRQVTWDAVSRSGDVDRVRHWAKEHPHAPQYREARALWRELWLSQLRREPVLELCDRFLREFRDESGVREVQRLRRGAIAWRKALRLDTLAGYRTFVRSYPASPIRAAALERLRPAYWRRRNREETPREHVLLQLAQACLVTGSCRLAEVEKAFRDALELSPESLPALLGLAKIEGDRGQLESAAGNLQKALDLDPSSAEALFLMGKITRLQGDCATALPYLDRALEGRPGHVETLYLRGRCLLRVGGCRSAVEDFRRVRSLAPPSDKFSVAAAVELRSCGVAGGER